jgi:uncharacterized protein YfbU (UPF0304 family)
MIINLHDIERWIENAKKEKCQFILEVRDIYDSTHHPVYCKDEIDLNLKKSEYATLKMHEVTQVIEV